MYALLFSLASPRKPQSEEKPIIEQIMAGQKVSRSLQIEILNYTEHRLWSPEIHMVDGKIAVPPPMTILKRSEKVNQSWQAKFVTRHFGSSQGITGTFTYKIQQLDYTVGVMFSHPEDFINEGNLSKFGLVICTSPGNRKPAKKLHEVIMKQKKFRYVHKGEPILLAEPNGLYSVHLMMGDAAATTMKIEFWCNCTLCSTEAFPVQGTMNLLPVKECDEVEDNV